MILITNFAKTVALSLAAAATFGAMPAAAQDTAADVPHADLDIAHVDFTSPKAVNALKVQLRRLATEICTPFSDGTGRMSSDEMHCYNTAMKGGLAAIDSHRQLALAHARPTTVAANTQVRPVR